MELFFVIYLNDEWSDFIYYMETVEKTDVTLSNLSSLTDLKDSSITSCGPFYYLRIAVSVTNLASAGSASCTITLPNDCYASGALYQPGYISSSIAIGSVNVNTKTFGLRNCSSGAMTGNLIFFFMLYHVY